MRLTQNTLTSHPQAPDRSGEGSLSFLLHRQFVTRKVDKAPDDGACAQRKGGTCVNSLPK